MAIHSPISMINMITILIPGKNYPIQSSRKKSLDRTWWCKACPPALGCQIFLYMCVINVSTAMSPATCHRPRCPSSPRRQNQVPLKEFDLGARDACDPRKRQAGIYRPPAISLAGFMAEWYGSVSKPCTPVVHIKIAGKWMFIPLKMVLIGIDS